MTQRPTLQVKHSSLGWAGNENPQPFTSTLIKVTASMIVLRQEAISRDIKFQRGPEGGEFGDMVEFGSQLLPGEYENVEEHVERYGESGVYHIVEGSQRKLAWTARNKQKQGKS